MKRVILFGAGGTGKRLIDELRDKYEIMCMVDSDSSKWGTYCKNYKIEDPDLILKRNEFDYVIVASAPGYDAIMEKCSEHNIPENRIIDKYVTQTLESRRQFLLDWASLYGDLSGACAEVGVFEGDFAKYINEYFPTKKVYLFDTFEGFCDSDLEKEKEFGTSEAQEGDYSNTSVELVMGKCHIRITLLSRKGISQNQRKTLKNNFVLSILI